jgi:hypothetical protein
MLQFFDETGVNALPSGILVTIVGTVEGTSQAYTTPGGYVAVSPDAGASCTAAFFGQQAPPEPQIFTANVDGSTTAVTVAGYRSPALSQAGYIGAQIELWPRGWFSDAARSPGGVAYALATGLAATLAALDSQIDSTLAAMRLFTSSGTEIDSWVEDFLGSSFPRVVNMNTGVVESDASYIYRIVRRLTLLLTTYDCVQGVVTDYVTAIGFTAATITVFDQQTNPQLAAAVGIAPPQFCILFAYPSNKPAWTLGTSYLGTTTILGGSTYTFENPLSAQFDALVRSIKAIGTKPVYATSGVVS